MIFEVPDSRFTVLRKLGAGGMGIVFDAIDRVSGARVALKTLHELTSENVLCFKQEFRTLADVHHPNLIRLGELYCCAGQWFFTMERVDGVTLLDHVWGIEAGRGGDTTQAAALTRALSLSETLACMTAGDGQTERGGECLPPSSRGRRRASHSLNEARLRAAFLQLAEALDFLHRDGLLHRDIKPSNVLVTANGRVVLLDFGLAVAIERSGGDVAGTVSYMAPEQSHGAAFGPPADWYAFGVMLYEALTGARPFVGTPLSIIRQKNESEAPSAPSLRHGISKELGELCQQLLAREPERRPLVEQIVQCLATKGSTVSAPGLSPGLASRATSGTPSVRFVGREEELGRLEAFFDECCRGETRAVLIRGEPGMGKTALAQHFLARAGVAKPSTLVLASRCYEQESLPFKSLDGVMDELSEVLASLSPDALAPLVTEDVAALSQLFPVLTRLDAIATLHTVSSHRQAPTVIRHTALRAFKNIVERLRNGAAVILFVDDLQWTDEPGLEMLADLLALRPVGVLVVATARRPDSHATDDPLSPLTEALEAGLVTVLELQGLSDAASDELLLQCHESSHPDSQTFSRISGEAAGHPLLLLEYARFVRESGAVDADLQSLSLEDVLWQRTATLDARHRELLLIVALAGVPIPFEVLTTVAQDLTELRQSECIDDARMLSKLQLLRFGESLGAERQVELFYDGVREVLQARLIDSVSRSSWRRRAHASLGWALVEHVGEAQLDGWVFTIVRHLNASRTSHDGSPDVALAHLNLRAAELALAATAHADALRYVALSMEQLPEDPWASHASLMFKLQVIRMRAQYLSGDDEGATATFEEMAPHLRDPLEIAEAYTLQSYLEQVRRRYEAGFHRTCEGLRRLQYAEEIEHEGSLSKARTVMACVWRLRGVSAAAFRSRPVATDPQTRATQLLLSVAMRAVGHLEGLSFAHCTMLLLEYTWRQGVTEHSGKALAATALVHALLGKYESSAQYTECALATLDRTDSTRTEPGTLFPLGLVSLFHYTFEDADDLVRRGVRAALESGEYQNVDTCLTTRLLNYSFAMPPLTSCLELLATVEASSLSTHPELGLVEQSLRKFFETLRSDDASPAPFRSFRHHLETDDEAFLTAFVVARNIALEHYLFGDLDEAHAAVSHARPAGSMRSHILRFSCDVLGSLIDVRRYRRATLHERLRTRARGARDVLVLMHVSKRTRGGNLVSRAMLQRAAIKSLDSLEAALVDFEHAARLAADRGELWIEALTFCAAGHACRDVHDHRAAGYLRRAAAAFEQWGARRVARHLTELSQLESSMG